VADSSRGLRSYAASRILVTPPRPRRIVKGSAVVAIDVRLDRRSWLLRSEALLVGKLALFVRGRRGYDDGR
jgi:hypothetical protein